MPSSKRRAKHIAVIKRRSEVSKLYLAGKTQMEISEVFGVTQACISKDLRAIQDQWQADALMTFDKIKQRELAKIDTLEREYWDA
jgi:uncharacterized protein YerC